MRFLATNAVLVAVGACIVAPLAAGVIAKALYKGAKYLAKRGGLAS